jgi:hypothetical protein
MRACGIGCQDASSSLAVEMETANAEELRRLLREADRRYEELLSRTRAERLTQQQYSQRAQPPLPAGRPIAPGYLGYQGQGCADLARSAACCGGSALVRQYCALGPPSPQLELLVEKLQRDTHHTPHRRTAPSDVSALHSDSVVRRQAAVAALLSHAARCLSDVVCCMLSVLFLCVVR